MAVRNVSFADDPFIFTSPLAYREEMMVRIGSGKIRKVLCALYQC